jgi:hypothetical protein
MVWSHKRSVKGSWCQARNKESLSRCKLRNQIKKCVMKKMIEAITEVIIDNSHPFRKMEHQPRKTLKNRYERRKIKEYLHLTDWQAEEAV